MFTFGGRLAEPRVGGNSDKTIFNTTGNLVTKELLLLKYQVIVDHARRFKANGMVGQGRADDSNARIANVNDGQPNLNWNNRDNDNRNVRFRPAAVQYKFY